MPLFVSPIMLFSLEKCYLIKISNHRRNFLGQGGKMSPHPNTSLLTKFSLLLSSRGLNKRNCGRSGGKGVCILRIGSNKSPLFLTSLPCKLNFLLGTLIYEGVVDCALPHVVTQVTPSFETIIILSFQ